MFLNTSNFENYTLIFLRQFKVFIYIQRNRNSGSQHVNKVKYEAWLYARQQQ
jgi:hypothetical protein